MELSCRELRESAWAKLDGKWSQAAVAMFLYFVITLAISGIASAIHPSLSTVCSLLLLPMGYAIIVAFLRVSRGGEAPQVNELFSVYQTNFQRSFMIQFLYGLFVFLWTLLLIIPGIIMGYAYSMSAFIANDNPDLTEMECIKKSRAMMDGHKMDLFLLDLTFIGWFFLGILTLGIGYFWIQPYYYTARAEFYRALIGENGGESVDGGIVVEED